MEQTHAKPYKVFISHSSRDKEFVEELVKLIEFLGVDNNDKLFCSSIEGYQIPIGNDIFDYLREQFNNYRLFVIIIHSHNYYESPVCLNEMGAAWVLRSESFSILTPGFDYTDMKGVINEAQISVKIDSYDAKARLDELKDNLVPLFKKDSFNVKRWQSRRDEFLTKVSTLKPSVPEVQSVNSFSINEDLFVKTYLPVIVDTFQYLDIENYQYWTYNWAVEGKGKISKSIFDNLPHIPDMLHRLAPYNDQDQFYPLLKNLETLMSNYIDVCSIHLINFGKDYYATECFYKAIPHNPKYEEDLNIYEELTYLIADLTYELTRLLNLILEKVWLLIPEFNNHKIFVINKVDNKYIVYKESEKSDSPYPGLSGFLKIRSQRSFCYSKTKHLDFTDFIS